MYLYIIDYTYIYIYTQTYINTVKDNLCLLLGKFYSKSFDRIWLFKKEAKQGKGDSYMREMGMM